MNRIKYLLFLTFSLLFISCKTLKDLPKNNVYIMVYDYDNMPVKEVKISLDEKMIGFTDVNGRFVFEVDDYIEHSVLIEKQNYESITDSFIYDSSLVLYYKIGNTDQYLQLAELSLDEKKIDKAFLYVEKAVGIDNTRQDACFLKAIILFKQKKYSEFRECLNFVSESDIKSKLLKLLENVDEKAK